MSLNPAAISVGIRCAPRALNRAILGHSCLLVLPPPGAVFAQQCGLGLAICVDVFVRLRGEERVLERMWWAGIGSGAR